MKKLVWVRPLDFDAAAIRSEFEPLLADAEAAGLVPVVSFPRLSGHSYSGGYLESNRATAELIDVDLAEYGWRL